MPGEVSVIGYDDSRLARLTDISLTTVAQYPEQMARLAVEAVVEQLKGEPDMPSRDILLDPRLVVRGTTGPDVDGAHEPAVLVQRLGRGARPAAGVHPWR